MVIIDHTWKYSANFYSIYSMLVKKSAFVIELILLYIMREIVASSACVLRIQF